MRVVLRGWRGVSNFLGEFHHGAPVTVGTSSLRRSHSKCAASVGQDQKCLREDLK